MNALCTILAAITIVSIGYFNTAIRLARITASTAGVLEVWQALAHIIRRLRRRDEGVVPIVRVGPSRCAEAKS